MTRYRPREYEIEDGPWDPISGGASALLGTIGSLMMGAVDFPVEILKALKIKPSEKAKLEGNLKDNTIIDPNNGVDSRASSGLEPSGRVSTEESAPSNSRSSISELAADHSGTISILQPVFNEQPRLSRTSPDVSTASVQTGASRLGTEKEAHSPKGSMSALCDRGSSSKGPRESRLISSTSRPSTPGGTSQHHQRTVSGNQAGQISLDAALGAGKGIGRIVEAGLKSPMDFTLSIARGFHNAPKLYGDESVRPSEKITGIQSGLRAAGKVILLLQVAMVSGLT